MTLLKSHVLLLAILFLAIPATLLTPVQAMFTPYVTTSDEVRGDGGGSFGIVAAELPASSGGWSPERSRLRSAAMLRERSRFVTEPAESPAAEQARVRAHFAEVIQIVNGQTERNLAIAVERFRQSRREAWTEVQRHYWTAVLRANRAQQLERLSQYARRGQFPLNEQISPTPIPVFVDRHNTECAVGHLMLRSGWTEAVQEIARHDNYIYAADAQDGPLAQWTLQSGLTREEVALIQPAYGPWCLPFADFNLDGVVDWSDSEIRDVRGWDFSGQDLAGVMLCDHDLTGADFNGANLADAYLNLGTLTDADFSGALVTGASFDTSRGFTQEQLYSTASYQAKDLRGIRLDGDNLNDWDFSGQNLTDAQLYASTLRDAKFNGANLSNAGLWGASLAGADFSGAFVRGTQFGDATGFTSRQLYSTATYQAKNLRGIGLNGLNLLDWDLSGQDLTGAELSSASLGNLSGANLMTANLSSAKLRDADLSGAKIRGAQFYGASGFTKQLLVSTVSYQAKDLRGIGLSSHDLSNWDFSGQNLADADLYSVSLHNANLSGANLTRAKLGSAALTDADFSGAVINGTDFDGVSGFTKQQLYATASYKTKDLQGIGLPRHNLSDWDLSGQDLSHADLSAARLRDSNLTATNLTQVNLSGATLTNADLSGAVVTGARFGGAIGLTKEQLYSTASFQEKDLTRIGLEQADLSSADLRDQNLSHAQLSSSKLSDAKLNGANLTHANLSSSTLTRADLTGAAIKGASFSGSRALTKEQLYSTASYQVKDLQGIGLMAINLSDWDFSGQDMEGARLSSVSLRNVNLSGANLANATLTQSTFRETNLSGANLKNANLAFSSILSSATFDSGTLYNQWTVFPDGFNPETRGLTRAPSPPGDLNANDALDSVDVDQLAQRISGYSFGNVPIVWLPDAAFDLNGDHLVTADDHRVWVHDLKRTWIGDANLDGLFQSDDLTTVLAAGTYESNVVGSATWSTGDWNVDGLFSSTDLIDAMADGGYEQGPRASAVAVPEPNSIRLLVVCGSWLVLEIGRSVCRSRRGVLDVA